MCNKIYKNLKEIVEQVRGISYKPIDIFSNKTDNSIAILRANNIKDNKLNFNDLVYINKELISKKQYLMNGDILICTSSGSKNLVGKAAQVNENLEMSFGAFCKVVRAKDINNKYLNHFFSSPIYRSEISRVSIGSNINNIRKEHIDNLKIPIYDKKTENKIVLLLDNIVSLLNNKKCLLEKYDELVKSQFIEMFKDFDLSFQKEDWFELYKLGDIIGGSTPKTHIKEFWNGNLNWITPAELKENEKYIYESQRKITEKGAKSCSLKEMPFDTVILSTRAPIGKVAISKCKFYCNQGFKNIICGKLINPVYLYTLLKFNIEYLKTLGKGATFKEISKTTISKVKIPTPPIELQNKFADFVQHIDKLKFTIKKSIEKLENCYNSLMIKYFE